jgi:phosphoglycolate phosphatase
MHETFRGAVKGFLFDLDGTLIDSKKDLVMSVNATLREIGRAELPEERVAGYVGSGAPLLISQALGGASSPGELQHALQFFLAHYEIHKLDHTKTYPGVRATLERLQGVKMAILTNKPVDLSVGIVEGLGLGQFFQAIYGGNSFATKKPDPLGAITVLRELGLPAAATVMVGDSEVDVQTARNAGMISAVVNFGFGRHDRAHHPADLYLDRMEELIALATTGFR